MSVSSERIDDATFYAYAHPGRKRRFNLALVFATLLFPLIAAGLIAGTVVLVVPLVALLWWMAMRVFFARTMGNMVLVSELNYPRINSITEEMKQRLGYDKRVYVFVYEEAQFNTYLIQFFFRRAIFLNSEIVEEGVSDDEVRWLVGRFIGYLRARRQSGALGLLIRAAQKLLVFNLFLLPYERSMVLTGDRLAVAAIGGDVSSAISALQKILVGRNLGYSLNPEGIIAQHRLIKGTFFGFLSRVATAFPHTSARYVDLIAFAKLSFPSQYARFLAANAAMPEDLLLLAGLTEGSLAAPGRGGSGMAAGWATCGITLTVVAGVAFTLYDAARLPSYEMNPLNEPTVESREESTVESREAEALVAGYEIDQRWSELRVQRGMEGYVDIDAQVGNDYLVLARGTDDCDVDAVVTEEIKDDGLAADATVEFSVNSAQTVRVRFPVSSQSHECVVGVGVYRRLVQAMATPDK